MIGELGIWLMVIATDPASGKKYLIEDKEETSIETCVFDQLPWLQKGMTVKRGNWEVLIGCALHHEEAQDAKLIEPDDIPPEVKAIMPVRPKDSGKEVPKNKRKSAKPQSRP